MFYMEKISDSKLSNRSKNQLIKNGYVYTYQLKNITDEVLENIKNLGAKSVQEIKEFKRNIVSAYEVDIQIPLDVPIEPLKKIEIKKVIDDEHILSILKINNVQIISDLIDLSYEDIQKFRNIDNNSALIIRNICIQLREKINIVDKNLFELVCRYPSLNISEIIYDNIPKISTNISIKYLFENRYKNELNIENHNFSKKEKKFLLTHDLNKINKLLSISYNNLLNNPGISKKSLNSILKKLSNQVVVQNNHTFFIGNISRLYLKESYYNYLLFMREDLLSNILNNMHTTINKILKDESFSINHEIDLLMGNEFINEYIYNLEVNELTSKEILYAYIKNKPYTYSKREICDTTESHFKNLNSYAIFDELIKLDLIATDEFDKVYTKNPSILSYVAENYNENTLEMMKLRLEGNTLEDIGNIIGVTRERVRQVVKKVIDSTNEVFKEDENAYWFSNYNLDNKQYQWLFKDNLYHYLSNRYKKGNESWKHILDDDQASTQLKMIVRNELLKDKIEIDNKIIPKTRISIIEYALEEYGQESLHLEDLSGVINLLLEELGLDLEGFEIDIRYLENRLSDTSNAVSSGKKYYRYYDYDAYDWEYFYEEVNFDEWKNIEISSSILFKHHFLLMENYNIKNENELHNIIRRTYKNRKDLKVELTRMPNISIGHVNREQQIKDFMYEHAPIDVDKFVQLYSEKFGIKEQTIKANYLEHIDEYIIDDYIKSDFDSIDNNKVEIVKDIVKDKDFMFIEDLKKELHQDIPDLQMILKYLEYKTFTSYILKNEYETSVNYYNQHFYNNLDIVDLTNIDKRLWNLSSFSAWLYNKYKEMELLEFVPKKFITHKKLNEIGLTFDILEKFRIDVLEKLSDNKIWSINAIIDIVDNEKIDSFGFEPLFYRSILRGLENIYSNKIGGNYLLKRGSDFRVSDLIEEEVKLVKMVDIFDLTEIINEMYDINLEHYTLIEAIKKTNMYYDEIMEKVYLDLNYYYEEFEY